MPEFTVVKNNHDLENFFCEVAYLHDSIIRQCAIQSIGYVDEQLFMYGDMEPFHAKVFIQSQFSESPCIEIHFLRVHQLLLKDVFISTACGKVENQNIWLSFTRSEDEGILCCKRERSAENCALSSIRSSRHAPCYPY